jgi:hypothetical protein
MTMKSAIEVDALASELKSSGCSVEEITWQIALGAVGWAYVFGARGDYCDPQNRRSRYRDDHPTIKTSCQNFDGRKGCQGCKWYPGGKRTRCFDCRGLTYWALKAAGGPTLQGAGATSQWNTAANWAAKGTIDSIPEDKLVCLFVQKGSKMEHTGLGFHGETIEASVGVQHFTARKSKWTHWAIPAGVDGDKKPISGWRPTIRKGTRSAEVTECQQMLDKLGYQLGPSGVDGIFGSQTQKAVMDFQGDHGLSVDGVVGPMTWEELDKAIAQQTQVPDDPAATFTVHIPGLQEDAATKLAASYSGAWVTKEGEET